MVKHIVCLKLKDFAEGKSKSENAVIFTERLTALNEIIPVIKNFEVGTNAPAASKKNFDVALVTEFESFEDLQIYQNHPEHLKIADFVSSVSEIRAVVDFEF
jgi:hypothetical protein